MSASLVDLTELIQAVLKQQLKIVKQSHTAES